MEPIGHESKLEYAIQRIAELDAKIGNMSKNFRRMVNGLRGLETKVKNRLTTKCASPLVLMFVEDCCEIVRSSSYVGKDEIYRAYRTWFKTHGKGRPEVASVFFRNLRQSLPDLGKDVQLRTEAGVRVRVIPGLILKNASPEDANDE